MHKIYTNIGEHIFEVTADSANFMNLVIRQFTSLKKIPDRPVDMVVHIHGGYGTPLVTSDFSITEQARKLLFRRDDYLIDIDPDYYSANLYVYNGPALRQAFISLYSSFIVFRNWGFLMHGECVVDNGLAHLLCGGGSLSISDDSENPSRPVSEGIVLIKIASEGIRVFDSPFDEAATKRNSRSNLIGSVHFIQQAFQNKQMKAGRTYSLLRLLDAVFYWPHSTEQTRRVITMLRRFVQAAPVYSNYFQKREEIKELIS
ncbi:hypothetical protein [Sporolactobacillus sp. KGMB 08714]|uniref:hypothetical protein n=1 Tax=Sporolactobacillus sp. KGMB 08714 TaxID=3064704 RepID=UPI002FBEEDAA